MSNQLIPVFTGVINKEQSQLINARELHQFLDVTSRFNDWISNRIYEYKFTEDLDYISFTKKLVKPNGGRPSIEYHLTLDMAKELSMVERTEKGRQARKYFIDCEKRLMNISSSSDKSNYITQKQLNGLKNIVCSISDAFFYKDSFTQGVWKMIRDVTGVDSVQHITKDKLHLITPQLEKILFVTQIYLSLRKDTESEIIKRIFRNQENQDIALFNVKYLHAHFLSDLDKNYQLQLANYNKKLLANLN